jgi:ParB-like chromosome segregation protein Spo0J
MYFHKEGLFGFEQDESATTKWASYMRQILPQTVDEHMLEEKMSALKKSLKNLTNPSWHGEDEPENVENEIDSDSFEETESEEPIAHEGPQMDAKSTSSDSEKRQVKKCVACKTLKPQTEFTASQWKKNIDTIRCSACVSKLPAYQAPQLRQKPCRSCGLSKAFEGFSLNQWRKKQGEGRCSDCVKKGTLDHIPFSSLRPINVFQT